MNPKLVLGSLRAFQHLWVYYINWKRVIDKLFGKRCFASLGDIVHHRFVLIIHYITR